MQNHNKRSTSQRTAYVEAGRHCRYMHKEYLYQLLNYEHWPAIDLNLIYVITRMHLIYIIYLLHESFSFHADLFVAILNTIGQWKGSYAVKLSAICHTKYPSLYHGLLSNLLLKCNELFGTFAISNAFLCYQDCTQSRQPGSIPRESVLFSIRCSCVLFLFDTKTCRAY